MHPTSELKARVRRQFDLMGQRYQRISQAQWNSRPREVLRWLPHPANARVLDLACGPGNSAYLLSQGAQTVVGLDLSKAMLQAARERCAAKNVTFVQGDGLHLPFASQTFDACYISFCFAHIFRARQLIREMTRILRPNGILAVMDVVAMGRRQSEQVNRLERAREGCYTRIYEFTQFMRLFCGLPLEWRSCQLTKRAVDFRSWIMASCLNPGSAAFRHARAVFRRASAEQESGHASASSGLYQYLIAQFLLRRMA